MSTSNMNCTIVKAIAGEDMSALTHNVVVYQTATGTVMISDAPSSTGSADSECLGVLVNRPASGEVAEVAIAGLVEVKIGSVASIQEFDELCVYEAGADGSVHPEAGAASGDYIVGTYIPDLNGGAYRTPVAGETITIALDVLKRAKKA